MSRSVDTVEITSVSGGNYIAFDKITQFEITNSLSEPASALIEVGGDSTWEDIFGDIEIGNRWAVYVNGKPRLRGRMLARRLPISADGGATVQLTIRTIMADAMFSSADPNLQVTKGSLKDAVVKAYSFLGLTEEDFVFEADLAVSLMTGGTDAKRKAYIADITEEDAKVHPPETVYAFVERHLNRFHLSHWDGPDGRIVVGAPDAWGTPIYSLRCRRDDPSGNNVLNAEKVEDFEQMPSVLAVCGVGGGKLAGASKIRAMRTNDILTAVDPVLFRPVIVVDETLKTQSLAEARATKEMTARAKQTDAWTIEVDGLSYWDGSKQIPWSIDTMVDVDIDLAGARAHGAYMLHKVSLRGSATDGYTSSLEMVGHGLWVL